jgi:membrane-associated phospholipid phosphatase
VAPDPAVAILAGLLTQLGAAWFVVGIGALLVVRSPSSLESPRQVGWVVIALALAAFGTVGVLKPLFAVPRPPGAATATVPSAVPAALAPVVEWALTGDGFAFPSGHAAVATAAYGGLAILLASGRFASRVGTAALLVATVAGTRLVLGVHRPADVVAGVVVGGAVLGLVLGVAGGGRPVGPGELQPRRALGVAAGTLVVAVGVSLGTGYGHGTRTALLALGVAVVALALSERVLDRSRTGGA